MNSIINKYKIKIGLIDFNENNFKIISDDGKTFISKIKKGSVDFKIFNEHNQEVNLSNLESGDLIQVYGSSKYPNNDHLLSNDEKKDVDSLLKLIGGSTSLNNSLDNNNKLGKIDEKNSIIIKKIIIKNKYVFNSESSEEFDSYN
jgi:hypothetical protein